MATGDRLAIDGGPRTRDAAWPNWPVYGEAEERALLEVLHSGEWWSVGGKKVTEFEQAFASYQDAQYGCCVTNGTAALEIALRALGIGCGDEVIVPPYTFIATASSVLAVSASPVFVDVEPDTLNMDPARIEAAITPRTRAIMPVHMAGRPADMDAILAIAKRHGLLVIEDSAQAHAAAWNGTRVGAIGEAGTFSFQASKNINAGEGGIILTNNEETADKLWSVANVGRTRKGKWYEHQVLGGNFRLTEWQGAILLCQLARLEEQVALRTENATYLTQCLRDVPGIMTMREDPRVTCHANHLFMFRYDASVFGGKTRQEFLAALGAEGIGGGSGYVPLYREVVFQRKTAGQGSWCKAGRPIDYAAFADLCPVCEQVCQDTVWLFQSQLLGTRADMDSIAAAIAKIQAAWA